MIEPGLMRNVEEQGPMPDMTRNEVANQQSYNKEQGRSRMLWTELSISKTNELY